MHPIARLPPGTGLRPAGRQLLVGAALAAAGARAQRPEMNCTYTSPSGDYYDIGPLVRASDFVISDSTGAHVFYWNSCGGVERRGEELDFQCDASDVACERGDAGRGRYYGLGKLDTVQFNTVYGRQGLLEARYTGGTETPTGPRRITVEIECDRNAKEPRLEMHHVPSAPNYLLTVQSDHGCVKEAPPAPPPPPAPSPADCRYVGPSGNSGVDRHNNLDAVWSDPKTNAKVYIGNLSAAKSETVLLRHGIKHIVNCQDLSARNFHETNPQFHYLRFPVAHWFEEGLETHEDVLAYFHRCHGWIQEALDGGSSVLIHCLAPGAHRAGTTGVSWLMHAAQMDRATATAAARQLRSVVDPFGHLIQILEKLEAAQQAQKSR